MKASMQVAVATIAIAFAALSTSNQLRAQSLVTGEQSDVRTRGSIPVRQLTSPDAVSNDTVGSLNGVRQLSDGRVFVNDAGRKRLLIFSGDLASMTVIGDSATTGLIPYTRASVIMPYLGDTTLVVDAIGRSLLVVDSNGRMTRVMSLPRPNDANAFGGREVGAPSIDRSGNLVYRTSLFPAFKAPVVGKPYTPPTMPDSAPIIRVNFDTRQADTVAWVRTAKMLIKTVSLPNGGVRLTAMVNPVSTLDDWTLLPDGTIAVIRGSDYHVDWFAPDKSKQSTSKLPFDWKALSDETKSAIIDSTRATLQRNADAATSRTASSGGAAGAHTGGGTTGHGMTIMPIGVSNDGTAQAQDRSFTNAPDVPEVVPASELPDYYPPVPRTGFMKADPEGRVWILPSTSASAGKGLLYDVVDRTGRIVERVRLPEGRALEGFGVGGVVYLTSHGAGGVKLERARLESVAQ